MSATQPESLTVVSGDSAPDEATGPLAGLRVLELGSLIAGPFAGRLLGDMGAEVIKLEAPGRTDPLRDWGHEQYKGRSLMWAVMARNKKCVTLDLQTPAGQETFRRLVAVSDVVVENFRPGTMERWNLSYHELAQVNPRVVLARVSGYGQTGPYASRAGYASVAEAMGGLRYVNGFPGELPPRAGISLGDALGGMFAVIGVLAAVNHARVSGQGQEVDVSLMESCFALMESALPEYDLMGTVRGPSGTSLKGVAPSNIFLSKDGRWVVIAANQDALFLRLTEVMGRPELASDPKFATHLSRGAHQEELDGLIAQWASDQGWQDMHNRLNAVGVVCGPIYSIADIVDDPQYQARDMLLPHHDDEIGSYLGPGVVPKFSHTAGGVRWSGSAKPGSHNEEILEGLLGLDQEELAVMRDAGVIT